MELRIRKSRKKRVPARARARARAQLDGIMKPKLPPVEREPLSGAVGNPLPGGFSFASAV